jgi:hypothetical protein
MSRNKSKIDWLAVIITMAIFSAILSFLFSGYQECMYDGGAYVRSLFWFTCIK